MTDSASAPLKILLNLPQSSLMEHSEHDKRMQEFSNDPEKHIDHLLNEDISEDLRKHMIREVSNEKAYDALLACIFTPVEEDPDNLMEDIIKRSYCAMNFIVKDMLNNSDGKTQLLTLEKAGALATKCFEVYYSIIHQSLTVDPNQIFIPHVNKLLETLLKTYPSSVLLVACAGKVAGIEKSVEPLMILSSHFSSSAWSGLSLIQSLLQYAIQGKNCCASTINPEDALLATKLQRRKFIKSLVEWGFTSHFIEYLVSPPFVSALFHIDNIKDFDMNYPEEEMCDSFLTIIEKISYKSAKDEKESPLSKNDYMGEDQLLNALGEEKIINKLATSVALVNSPPSSSVARVLLGLYELATRKSKQTMENASVSNFENEGVNRGDGVTLENKIRTTGLSTQIHNAYVQNIPLFIAGMNLTEVANMHFVLSDYNNNPRASSSSQRLKNIFSLKRFMLVKLLASMLDFELEIAKDGDNMKILDILSKLSYPKFCFFSNEKPKQPVISNRPTENGDALHMTGEEIIPWPCFIDMLFLYFPDHDFFHNQFYRLFYSILIMNHEDTLRVILKKSKFLSRAINIFENMPKTHPLYGIVLRCLNAMRLQYQNIQLLGKASSNMYVKLYLEGHDKWIECQDSLINQTLNQQKKSGFSIPALTNINQQNGTENMVQNTIDLGSNFAAELGFDNAVISEFSNKYKEKHVTIDEESSNVVAENNSNAKKKKKKKRRKSSKMKEISVDANTLAAEEEADQSLDS